MRLKGSLFPRAPLHVSRPFTTLKRSLHHLFRGQHPSFHAGSPSIRFKVSWEQLPLTISYGHFLAGLYYTTIPPLLHTYPPSSPYSRTLSNKGPQENDRSEGSVTCSMPFDYVTIPFDYAY